MRYFDCHSHFSTRAGLHHRTMEEYENAQRVFKRKRSFETEQQMADGFRTRGVRTILDIYRTWRMTDEDEIRASNDYAASFARDNREVFRIVFGHAAAYNEVIRRAQALFAADVEDSVRRGIAIGAFAPLPPALVAQAVIGMATQVLSWWTANESVSLESLHETMFTLSLDGLRARTPKKGASR